MEHTMEKSQDNNYQISIVIIEFQVGLENGCQPSGRQSTWQLNF